MTDAQRPVVVGKISGKGDSQVCWTANDALHTDDLLRSPPLMPSVGRPNGRAQRGWTLATSAAPSMPFSSGECISEFERSA